jgi:hypothetical protein
MINLKTISPRPGERFEKRIPDAPGITRWALSAIPMANGRLNLPGAFNRCTC